MQSSIPIICLVGCDGSGKSTLARHAVEVLRSLGRRPVLVWSRFNNLTSKPLLALARLTGHNRRETHGGIPFGYHDFQSAAWLRWLFPRLQAIDVNLATCVKLRAARRAGDIIVLERGPCDTLADVILDTGDFSLANSRCGRWITEQVRGRGQVFWIVRPREAILTSRWELMYDRRLDDKIAIYEMLAARLDWQRLDNNRPLAETKECLAVALTAFLARHDAARQPGGQEP
jgi:predicted ATPase